MKTLIHHRDTEGAELERLNKITEAIIGGSIKVHRVLGPGLLESAYQECLCRELSLREISFQREVALPISYEGIRLDCGYRIDLLVAGSVIVELISVEQLNSIHEAQLLTYLKLSAKRIGLLINFNVPLLKDGILRRVL